MKNIAKVRIIAFVLLLAGVALGFFVYESQVNKESKLSNFPFKLGLDLSGGSHLVYRADVSEIGAKDVGSSMEALRDVIETRVNLFGVSEPLVQVEGGSFSGKEEHKLIVELPGVTNIQKAIELIGKTPLLEFKLLNEVAAAEQQKTNATTTPSNLFISTGLTGRLLEKSQLEFESRTNEPIVSLVFNDEGSTLFAKVTKENVGKVLAIFLDGKIISSPVIRDEILSGKAQITGGFDPKEAKLLVRDLNYGALPVPIELISTQTIGASLGEEAKVAGVHAGLIAFLIIGLFLILWYRLPGLIAVCALVIYTALNLALFKLIPVTLTAAGIAGFILSIGMAVDANILIFERMKEELKNGKNLHDAINEGFARAWLSIRDSNLSSIITAIILFMFASTSIIKGFALVFGIGVVVSMFTAITASRMFLKAVQMKDGKVAHFLFGNGLSK